MVDSHSDFALLLKYVLIDDLISKSAFELNVFVKLLVKLLVELLRSILCNFCKFYYFKLLSFISEQ